MHDSPKNRLQFRYACGPYFQPRHAIFQASAGLQFKGSKLQICKGWLIKLPCKNIIAILIGLECYPYPLPMLYYIIFFKTNICELSSGTFKKNFGQSFSNYNAYALNLISSMQGYLLLGSLNDLHNVEFFIITKIAKFKSFFNPLSRHIQSIVIYMNL